MSKIQVRIKTTFLPFKCIKFLPLRFPDLATYYVKWIILPLSTIRICLKFPILEKKNRLIKELLRKCPYMPYKSKKFNSRTLGKCFYLVICLISRHGFQTKFFHISPNFGDFGAKMSFFRYIINQKRKIFIKHCPPPCSNTPLISEMCIYITNNLCKWGLGTRGGDNVLQAKNGGGPASGTWNTVTCISTGKLHKW